MNLQELINTTTKTISFNNGEEYYTDTHSDVFSFIFLINKEKYKSIKSFGINGVVFLEDVTIAIKVEVK